MRTSSMIVSFVLLPTFVFSGCSRESKTSERSAAQLAVAAQRRQPMRFRTEICVDRNGTGGEAFRMLVPAGWKFASGITWVLDNPGMPATAWLCASNPSSPEALEIFRNQSFFWTDNPMNQQMFPPGSKYFGAEVRAPVGPVQALKSIVLRRFRQSVGTVKVIAEEHLPDLAAALGVSRDQPGMSADGGKIRVRYGRQGAAVEEEFYALVESFKIPIQSTFGQFTNNFWTVSYIFSVKAPEGRLDSLGALFQTLGSSVRVNPAWMNAYAQVVDFLIRNQMQKIRSAGELSRIISQTHREISDDMMRSWEERQGVYDRLSERFSQNIRSVDEYYDPVSEKSVELPAGYRNAWVNGLGEYVIAEQEDFNPNIGSNQNWQRMERKDH
jgi:hypothetical protein